MGYLSNIQQLNIWEGTKPLASNRQVASLYGRPRFESSEMCGRLKKKKDMMRNIPFIRHLFLIHSPPS